VQVVGDLLLAPEEELETLVALDDTALRLLELLARLLYLLARPRHRVLRLHHLLALLLVARRSQA
jgi:hypothetical protein